MQHADEKTRVTGFLSKHFLHQDDVSNLWRIPDLWMPLRVDRIFSEVAHVVYIYDFGDDREVTHPC